MSFFFDVWTTEGFILASDVHLKINNERKVLHKVVPAPKSSNVVCAIAVCGDYPESCRKFFYEATLNKNTLRDVAYSFATKWTERYSTTQDYSAVHLVGFETIPDCDMTLPQMWFWCNWRGRSHDNYYSEEKLLFDLKSFSEPIPNSNHIPHKIKELTGKFPESTLKDEAELVNIFLKKNEPYFTWNGDTTFWRSALETVNSAMSLLKREKTNWSIDDVGRLTGYCLAFLANTGSLLNSSTVALSSDQKADILKITPSGVEKISWTNLDE